MADEPTGATNDLPNLADSSTSAEATTLAPVPQILAQPNGTTSDVDPTGSNSQSGRYAQPPVAGATGSPLLGADQGQVEPGEAARRPGEGDGADQLGPATARVDALALESRALELFQELRQLLTVFPFLFEEQTVRNLREVAMELVEEDQEDAAWIQQRSGEILAGACMAERAMRESGGAERVAWGMELEALRREAEEVVAEGWEVKRERMGGVVVALEWALVVGVEVGERVMAVIDGVW